MLLDKTEKDGVVSALYESSNILASKWDGKDLTVIFKRGASYTYKGVSKSDYTRFELADSQGAILNAKIKAYSFTQNDAVNEIAIVNEINETKADNLRKFEEGLIEHMRLISSAYETNQYLSKVSLEQLTSLLVKHSEMSDTATTIKICACE